MERLSLNISYVSCAFEDLSSEDAALVVRAKEMCEHSYAPYSKFCVGAAVSLDNGEVVCGSNQENAAYPSGTCAVRCTMFYANARYPEATPLVIAIAAKNEKGQFTPTPITPCGACRQVLIETQHRYNHPLRVLLYGASRVYCLDSVSDLLPFQFDADALSCCSFSWEEGENKIGFICSFSWFAVTSHSEIKMKEYE